MNFDLSEEQKLLQASASRFVRDALSLKPVDQRPQHTDIWARMADMGWLALPLPERAGGLDGSFEDVLVLMTMLGGGVISTAYVSNIVLCGFILAAAEANPDAEALLSLLAAGEARVALAHRASAEGDVTATLAPDGGHVLNGGKILSHDAPHAAALLISARVDGRSARSIFLVDAAAAGVAIEAYPLIDGGWAGDLLLQDAQGALLVEGEAAEALLGEALDRAVLANLAQIVGAVEACLEVCSEYLKVREQFGRPLGKFQALQHIMSTMYVEAQEARSILYYALSAIEGSAGKRGAALAEAAIVIGEAGQLVSENGIQLHGGYGVTDEFSISHYYRRIMTLGRMFEAGSRHA